MGEYVAHLRWGRVVLAGVAAHAVDDLIFALIPFAAWLVSPVAVLITPGLTALLAFWVARSVESTAAVRHGLMVGLVSGVIGFLLGLPSLWTPMAAVTVGAGALGGLVASQTRTDRRATAPDDDASHHEEDQQ